ncbi:MAG: MBG domain-containing protein [Verrucomicrobiota bacterium]
MLPESMHWQFSHATNVMSDVTTSNLVDILAGHNYGSSAAPVTQFGTPCPKTLWETEHYIDTDDSITNALLVAQEIHSFLTVAQANAYHYWWLIGSGTGSIADNTANPAKRLFAMGNYSKFIRPNYYRVAVTNTAAALVSAYKDPASSNFVIVAANNSAFALSQTFTLTNFPVVGSLRQWVTSATEPLANHGGAITLTNGTFATVLPAWTVTTYVYQQPVTNPPTIVQPPANQIALPGDTIVFSVQATGGTAPLYYQWLFNGTNIIGATNASVAVVGATLTNTGNYSVIVTNYAGSVTSSVASLNLITITWNTPVTISGAADISTNGTGLYAYNNSSSAATVNNVTFTGVNSFTAWGTGVTLGGWNGTSTSAFTGGASTPWNNLPAGYKTLLQGGAYNDGAGASVTLNNLTIGHQYQIQVWVNDSRSGGTTNRTETLPGVSGSTVTLAYNSTYAGGGVGQYTIGTFTATATNQVFTMDGNSSTQLNALQVRDVTPAAVNVSPATTNLIYGNSVLLTANASGATPYSYKWYDNHTNAIAWGTNASLTLTNPPVAASGNYLVVVQNTVNLVTNFTTVTVTKAMLAVNANNTNRVYGVTNPPFNVNYTGFVNGENAGVLSGSPSLTTSATTNSPMGVYVITNMLGTLTAANYAFNLTNASLNITPATLTVTANNTNRLAGSSNPTLTASYTGWMNADTFISSATGSPALSTTANANSPPGNYSIQITSGTLAATNYNFNLVNGTLSITSASYPTNFTVAVSGGSLVLNWPATHLGWTLQAQTNPLAGGLGTNWVDVPATAATNNFSVPLNPANNSVFYRLRR